MTERTCSIQDCEGPHFGQGYCRKHYTRWYRHGDPLIGGRAPSPRRRGTCSIEGCDRPTKSLGWCYRHLLENTEQPVCVIPDCERPVNARGWCASHYHRWQKYGDPLAGGIYRFPRGRICVIPGCGEVRWARDWCQRHYGRWHRNGDPELIKRSENGHAYSRHVTPQGYVRISMSDGQDYAEHRLIMEQTLDRPLWPEETVHHKNGVRHDNRIENLELWVSWRKQPSGQRVEDLLAFVVERYPEQLRAILAEE